MDVLDTNPFPDYGTMDITFLGFEPVLFPSFELKTRKKLFDLIIFTMFTKEFLPGFFNDIFNVLGIVLSVIQVLVMMTKSMRNSTINIILIVLAINQILLILHELWGLPTNQQFTTKPKQTLTLIDISIAKFRARIISNFFKRNSFWLPLLIAFNQVFVIFNLEKSKSYSISTGKFGLITSGVLLAISTLVSLTGFSIVTSNGLSPSKEFYRIIMKYADAHDEILMIIQYIIPTILCPILIIMLLIGIPKANRNAIRTHRKDYATKMVLTITIFFMLSAIPFGFSSVLCVFCGKNLGFYYLGQSLFIYIDFIHPLIGSLYCIITWKMTPGYKNIILNVFKLGNKYGQNAVAPEAAEGTTGQL